MPVVHIVIDLVEFLVVQDLIGTDCGVAGKGKSVYRLPCGSKLHATTVALIHIILDCIARRAELAGLEQHVAILHKIQVNSCTEGLGFELISNLYVSHLLRLKLAVVPLKVVTFYYLFNVAAGRFAVTVSN